MEADWSVEIGPGLSRVDASWDGFVDPRKAPEAINFVAEARQHPALREALLALNGVTSSVFTAKCDAWALTDEEIDPDEFGAAHDAACAGFASYIDIVERDPARFASFEFHERRVRELTSKLRGFEMQQGRVDFVVRSAVLREQNGFGLTLYAAGCGATEADAYIAWQSVLASAVAATIGHTGE